jgi:exonuclease SbcC
MKLTTITASNLRGFNFRQPLTGRDILIGQNGQGKTSRLDTIDYVLQGYSRRQGKELSALLGLFDGEEMKLGLEAVDGENRRVAVSRQVERRCDRKTGAAKVEQTITTTLHGAGTGTRELEAAIRVAFGSVPEALDLRELLALTVSERRRLIFGMADLAQMGWSREACLEKIRAAVVTHEVRAQADLLEQAERHLGLLTREWGTTTSVQEGLARLVKWTDEALKTAKVSAVEAERGARALADQAAATGATGDPREAAGTLTAKREELAELRAKLAVDADRRRAIVSRSDAIRASQRRCAELSAPASGESPAMTSLRERIAVLQQPAPDTTHIEQKIAALRCQVQTETVTDEQCAEAERAERAAYLKLTQATSAVSNNKAELDRLQASKTALENLCGKTCSECTRPFTAEEATAMIAILEERCGAGLAASAVLEQQECAADREHDAAAAALAALRDRQKAARKLCDEITQYKQQLTVARQEAKRRTEDLARERTRLTEMGDAAMRQAEQRFADLGRERARLIELQAEDAGAPAVIDTEARERQCAAIEAEIRALEARHEAQQKADGLEGLRLDAAKKKVQADAAVTALKAIKEACGPKGLQGDVCGALVSPLEVAANELLALVQPDLKLGIDLVDENGAEDFDFCWVRTEGTRIRWGQLSAGYALIFGAALAIALLKLRNPPCKILKVDNVDVLDAQRCSAFFDALEKMSAGIDNIICAGVGLRGGVSMAWAIHQVGPVVEPPPEDDDEDDELPTGPAPSRRRETHHDRTEAFRARQEAERPGPDCADCGSWGIQQDPGHVQPCPASHVGPLERCKTCGAWAKPEQKEVPAENGRHVPGVTRQFLEGDRVREKVLPDHIGIVVESSEEHGGAVIVDLPGLGRISVAQNELETPPELPGCHDHLFVDYQREQFGEGFLFHLCVRCGRSCCLACGRASAEHEIGHACEESTAHLARLDASKQPAKKARSKRQKDALPALTPEEELRRSELTSTIKRTVGAFSDEQWQRFCVETSTPKEAQPLWLKRQSLERLIELEAAAQAILGKTLDVDDRELLKAAGILAPLGRVLCGPLTRRELMARFEDASNEVDAEVVATVLKTVTGCADALPMNIPHSDLARAVVMIEQWRPDDPPPLPHGTEADFPTVEPETHTKEVTPMLPPAVARETAGQSGMTNNAPGEGTSGQGNTSPLPACPPHEFIPGMKPLAEGGYMFQACLRCKATVCTACNAVVPEADTSFHNGSCRRASAIIASRGTAKPSARAPRTRCARCGTVMKKVRGSNEHRCAKCDGRPASGDQMQLRQA